MSDWDEYIFGTNPERLNLSKPQKVVRNLVKYLNENYRKGEEYYYSLKDKSFEEIYDITKSIRPNYKKGVQ